MPGYRGYLSWPPVVPYMTPSVAWALVIVISSQDGRGWVTSFLWWYAPGPVTIPDAKTFGDTFTSVVGPFWGACCSKISTSIGVEFVRVWDGNVDHQYQYAGVGGTITPTVNSQAVGGRWNTLLQATGMAFGKQYRRRLWMPQVPQSFLTAGWSLSFAAQLSYSHFAQKLWTTNLSVAGTAWQPATFSVTDHLVIPLSRTFIPTGLTPLRRRRLNNPNRWGIDTIENTPTATG